MEYGEGKYRFSSANKSKRNIISIYKYCFMVTGGTGSGLFHALIFPARLFPPVFIIPAPSRAKGSSTSSNFLAKPINLEN